MKDGINCTFLWRNEQKVTLVGPELLLLCCSSMVLVPLRENMVNSHIKNNKDVTSFSGDDFQLQPHCWGNTGTAHGLIATLRSGIVFSLPFLFTVVWQSCVAQLRQSLIRQKTRNRKKGKIRWERT